GGPGGSAYGYSHILLMPVVGDLEVQEKDYGSKFSHESETASPGYYSVTLDDYKIKAEMTATGRCGFHRYTFPESENSRILMDIGHTRGESVDGFVEIAGTNAIKGFGIYNVFPAISFLLMNDPGTTAITNVHFYAEFSKPFESFGVWRSSDVSPGVKTASGQDVGAFVNYKTAQDEAVEVRVCISFIDAEQARDNFKREIEGRSFEEVRDGARKEWNRLLNMIQVEGGTDEQRTIFYSALYRAMFQPADYSEYGRYWDGSDGKGTVYDAGGYSFYNDDWCMWDTFRTTHPLQILIEPERRDDIIQSMVRMYEHGGWLPKCTWQATGYSRIMIGNHALSIIADAFMKGFDGFDVEKAYEGMKKGATEDNPNPLSEGGCGYLNNGTPPDYVNLGYVPNECDIVQSVSMTLEYAYDDFCLANLAKALGREEDYGYFIGRAGNYRNNFNPAHGFMQRKNRKGEWIEPFDPAAPEGFCEADSWKYTWFVPHDVKGLIDLIGGREKFVEKLDAFFDGGHYDAGNEPDFHAPYLYVYSGAPWKTQKKVRELMEKHFKNDPYGLPGNDDAGATSAWFVFSAMGLYPVNPGDAAYEIGSPVFDKTTIYLNEDHYKGGKFVIEAKRSSEDDIYTQIERFSLIKENFLTLRASCQHFFLD
ncbi:MAG: GH92 family glycosyl hydrolase, partial [Deltaproteobacteria bacterium]|nr:GH92 family glycosyl hydrolase [Deltaproteobacteria bacterium]